MNKKYSWAMPLLACALAVGWLLGTPGDAAAEFNVPPTLNVVQVGSVDTGADAWPYSKLAPWPRTDGRYLYSGCYSPQQCFMTVDLKDPVNPVVLATVYTYDTVDSVPPLVGPNPASPINPLWTTAGDAKYKTLEIKAPCGDWKGVDQEAFTPAELSNMATCWDPGWNTHSHFVSYDGGILVVNQERWRGGPSIGNKRENWHGIAIYDVHKPEEPKFLSRFQTPASPPNATTGVYPDAEGAHHFHFDGRYVYFGSSWQNFVNRILVIVDLQDPNNPVLAGRWWEKGQRNTELADRYWAPQSNFSPVVWNNSANKYNMGIGMHWVQHHGNRLYMSYHQAGLIILDSTLDKKNLVDGVPFLKEVGRLSYLDPSKPDFQDQLLPEAIDTVCQAQAGGTLAHPAACGNTHSAKLIPGSNLMWVTDEYFTCPYGHLRLVDISDETNPQVISHFYYPETTDCGKTWKGRTPSTHLGNSWNNNLLFLGWYGLGMRVINISDPYSPKEAGYFTYESLGTGGMETYDVIFGHGRYLYVPDSVDGLRVLEYTGQGMSGN